MGTLRSPAFVPCHGKVIPDGSSPTVQMLLPQAGLSVEGFVELCFRKVILFWYFVMWERLGGGSVSEVSYAVSCSRGKGAGASSHFFIPVASTCSGNSEFLLGKRIGKNTQLKAPDGEVFTFFKWLKNLTCLT